jgi:hypothetical protein
VEKTNQLCILLALVECHFAIVSFNLWMFKGAYDVFALVINFLNSDWQLKHVIVDLFEATKNNKASLGQKFNIIIGQVWFKEKHYCLC